MAEKKVVGGLKWVKGEIGATLRPVRDLVESGDTSGVSSALAALNQVHGVLLALQLSTPARLVQEMVRLADRMEDAEGAQSAHAIEVMGQASSQLLGHLDRLDAGFDEPPLSLWSIINEVRAACDELPLSHSELLTFAALDAGHDSQWMPEALDVLGEVMRQVRPQFHRHLVDWYRGDPQGLHQLGRLFRQLYGYLKEGFLADLFRLAEIFADALRDQRLPSDQRARTLMGHIDWVLKPLVQQPPQWPEVDTLTLIEQLLAVLLDGGVDAPLVAQLQAWYGPAKTGPVAIDNDATGAPGDEALAELAVTVLGEFDHLKEQFDLLARGEHSDRASLDAFCADLRRIAATLDVAEVGNLPGRLRALADNFGALDPATLGRDQVRLESHAMELLGIEAVLLAYGDHRAGGGQVIAPDMDLSELTAATLREASYELLRVKELIADCHSQQDPLASLSALQGHLGSVSGALRILGESEAANLAESIADAVRRLFVGLGNQPSVTEFEHLADAVAGLELYIGHIQEAMPFGETMIERAIQAVAELEAEASRRPTPSEAIEDLGLDAYVHEETLAESVPVMEGQESTSDVETAFIDIFLEEANEETASARTQFALLEADPGDAAALASLRRSFHTLKGSGRLVGALQVGDFAQAIEYLLNRLIEGQHLPSADILACVAEAVRQLPDLVAAEADGRQYEIEPLVERANSLRAAIGAAAGQETSAAVPAGPPAAEPASTTEILDHDSLFAADEELLSIFRGETQEHIGVLRDFLTRAESGGDARPDEPVQRALHTLTGSARMAGMESIARVTKSLELHIRPALAAGAALDAGLLRLLQRGVDAVADRVEELPARGPGADALMALVDELERTPVRSPDAQEGRAEAPAAPAAERDTIGSGVELDFLAIAADERADALDATEESEEAEPERELAVGEASVEVVSAQAELPADEVPAEPLVSVPGTDARADTDTDAVAAPDNELAALFLEDARDLLDKLDTQFREWQLAPEDPNALDGINRLLHTLKGSARLTGLAVIGDLSHALETRLKDLGEGHGAASDGTLELAQRAVDAISAQVDALEQGRPVPRMADLVAALSGAPQETPPSVAESVPETVSAPAAPLPIVSVTRLAQAQLAADQGAGGREGPAAAAQIRVRSDLLNRLVNHAGEISIYRGRLTQRNGLLGFSLGELDQTVIRLREQLRQLEIETQTQILHRYERAGAASAYDAEFDPLELDRFSTLQQLSGSLAETVNDLISVKEMLGGYQREFTDLLNQQARLADDLQDGLLRTRLIPFIQVVPRLHRLVRQTADTLGKSARLEVLGPEVELDRTILDRLVAPLEHLLRNAVDHGLEDPKTRVLRGKPATGRVTLALHREGNDAVITLSDDGKGLDLEAIRKQAVARGLMAADAKLPDEALLQFILEPGFTTSGKVTQISGRGVGLDVVASEIKAANGTISLGSVPGKGAHFTIRLPLTLAIIEAFLVSAGDNMYAVPHSTVEGVARISRDQLSGILQGQATFFNHRDQDYKVVSLANVLDPNQEPELGERRWLPLLLARVGEQRVALHVDTLIESQRILVKPLGPQLAGVRWLSGGTILPDGRVALILDALALLRSGAVQNYRPAEVAPEVTEQPTCVLVVDDSLTVRRVTSRLLRRQNIEALTAKDGVEALTLLDERTPDLLLLDIEMPRMDGYELTRHIRRSERLRHLPIIMITSRTNAKHRDYAMQLGVDRYLGKPYQESELLSEIHSLLAERQREPALA